MSPNIAASVKDRLLSGARARGEEFDLTLTRFVAERWLYRLGKSAVRDRVLLKGASLLSVWLPDPYRATRDVDVMASGPSDAAAITALLTAVCAVPYPEDGVEFDLAGLRIEEIRGEAEYAGQRARFLARLGGARVSVKVDFGFGDAVAVAPVEVSYPVLLDSLAAPRVRAYPREVAVAEKFEAMVTLDVRNSRMKDFHDVWALSGAFAFEGPALSRAVSACFERRGTSLGPDLPRVLSPTFYQLPEVAARWRSYLAAGAVLVPPPAQFEAIGERIIGFLGPVRDAVVGGAEASGQWVAGGPWRSAGRPDR